MPAPRIDMHGKTVMLTGFTAGIGKSAATELAEMGADLVLVCRNPDKGKAVIEELRAKVPGARLDMLLGDLGSQADVRRIAAEFLAWKRPLHVLFNNAGVVMRSRTTTVDGLETTFAVNHLGYFLLTNLLLECLRTSAPSRVVCTASDAHTFSGALDFDDLQSEKRFSIFGCYGRSKLANILFTRELGRREAQSGVTTSAFHPGFVGSDFAKNNGAIARAVMLLARLFARSPAKGAETGVYLCTASDVSENSGGYYFDMKPHAPNKHGVNDAAAKRLWEISEQLTGLATS